MGYFPGVQKATTKESSSKASSSSTSSSKSSSSSSGSSYQSGEGSNPALRSSALKEEARKPVVQTSVKKAYVPSSYYSGQPTPTDVRVAESSKVTTAPTVAPSPDYQSGYGTNPALRTVKPLGQALAEKRVSQQKSVSSPVVREETVFEREYLSKPVSQGQSVYSPEKKGYVLSSGEFTTDKARAVEDVKTNYPSSKKSFKDKFFDMGSSYKQTDIYKYTTNVAGINVGFSNPKKQIEKAVIGGLFGGSFVLPTAVASGVRSGSRVVSTALNPSERRAIMDEPDYFKIYNVGETASVKDEVWYKRAAAEYIPSIRASVGLPKFDVAVQEELVSRGYEPGSERFESLRNALIGERVSSSFGELAGLLVGGAFSETIGGVNVFRGFTKAAAKGVTFTEKTAAGTIFKISAPRLAAAGAYEGGVITYSGQEARSDPRGLFEGKNLPTLVLPSERIKAASKPFDDAQRELDIWYSSNKGIPNINRSALRSDYESLSADLSSKKAEALSSPFLKLPSVDLPNSRASSIVAGMTFGGLSAGLLGGAVPALAPRFPKVSKALDYALNVGDITESPSDLLAAGQKAYFKRLVGVDFPEPRYYRTTPVKSDFSFTPKPSFVESPGVVRSPLFVGVQTNVNVPSFSTSPLSAGNVGVNIPSSEKVPPSKFVVPSVSPSVSPYVPTVVSPPDGGRRRARGGGGSGGSSVSVPSVTSVPSVATSLTVPVSPSVTVPTIANSFVPSGYLPVVPSTTPVVPTTPVNPFVPTPTPVGVPVGVPVDIPVSVPVDVPVPVSTSVPVSIPVLTPIMGAPLPIFPTGGSWLSGGGVGARGKRLKYVSELSEGRKILGDLVGGFAVNTLPDFSKKVKKGKKGKGRRVVGKRSALRFGYGL